MDLSAKRVMVTGGAGFLGSYVCEVLERRGCTEIFVPRKAEFDLTREADVVRALSVAEPDVVIHLAAAVGGIGANLREPARFFYENAIMTIQLIEQARRHGVEKFTCLGTVCAYPKHTPVPFREDDLWSGFPEETNAPYGIAKKAALVQLQAYRQQYGFDGIFLLPVNLYGPRDDFDLENSHVIPAMIRKFVEARESGAPSVTLWGSGEASREFLYVKDAAEAIVAATERYDSGDPVNIGAGFEITIRALAEKIREATGFSGEIVWDSSKPDGQPRRMLDTSRARKEFGFEATTALEEGLRATVEWFETGFDPAPNVHVSELPAVEEIRDGEQIIAVIVRRSFNKPGVSFFSQNEFSQQLGFINYPPGHVIQPHVHNPVPREVQLTQETLFIRDGRVRVDLYRDDCTVLATRVLTTGDAILLATGGHGFEILEASAIIEVKQGPYAGDGDKTRFEAAP